MSAGDPNVSRKLIQTSFVNLVLKSFDSFSHEIIDHILLALGNTVGDSVEARDAIVNAGVTDVLISFIEQYNSVNGTWAFVNLFRGHPPPSGEFLNRYFPFLMKRVVSFQNQQDIDIAEDCLKVLNELTGSL